MKIFCWVLGIVGITLNTVTGIGRFISATSFSGYMDGCAWILLGLFILLTSITTAARWNAV